MIQISKLLEFFVGVPTVSGHESEYSRLICNHLTDMGIDARTDNVGNIIAHKAPSGKPRGAILLDAHIDQIGFLVSSVEDRGFIKVAHVGGIDARTLPATDCTVITESSGISGVFASTPPHLSSGGDGSLKDTADIYIDTGLDTDTARGRIRIGDAVVYKASVTHLMNDCVSAPALDNKLCAAAITCAFLDICPSSHDIYLCLSIREEGGGFAGARVAINAIKPDIIMVFDANFARAPEVSERESVSIGKGPSVSLSALTDRELSQMAMSCAKEQGIPYQVVTEASNLGTNGNIAEISAEGARAVNMSLPLANMHSPSELASLSDAKALKQLVISFIGLIEKDGEDNGKESEDKA